MGIHVYNTQIFRQTCDSNKSVKIWREIILRHIFVQRERESLTERQRELERQTDRERDTETERDRAWHREKENLTERGREFDRGRERGREGEGAWGVSSTCSLLSVGFTFLASSRKPLYPCVFWTVKSLWELLVQAYSTTAERVLLKLCLPSPARKWKKAYLTSIPNSIISRL